MRATKAEIQFLIDASLALIEEFNIGMENDQTRQALQNLKRDYPDFLTAFSTMVGAYQTVAQRGLSELLRTDSPERA